MGRYLVVLGVFDFGYLLRRQVKSPGSQIRFYLSSPRLIAFAHQFQEALERGSGAGRIDWFERILLNRAGWHGQKLKHPERKNGRNKARPENEKLLMRSGYHFIQILGNLPAAGNRPDPTNRTGIPIVSYSLKYGLAIIAPVR